MLVLKNIEFLNKQLVFIFLYWPMAREGWLTLPLGIIFKLIEFS